MIEHVRADGVTISSGADPAFRDCPISDVEGIGLATAAGARGLLQGCEITRIDRRRGGLPRAQLDPDDLRAGSTTPAMSACSSLPGAGPVLEDCEIRDIGSHGMVLTEEADPVVRRCSVTRTGGEGISLAGRSRGSFTDCMVADTGAAGVVVGEASDPMFAKCRLRGTAKAALIVTDAAAGTFDRVDVRGAGQHGIEIRSSANPLLRQAAVVGCQGHGLTVLDEGRGRIEDSVIEGAAGRRAAHRHRRLPGRARDPVRRQRGEAGVLIGARGRGVLRECEVVGAGTDGVVVEDGGDISVSRPWSRRATAPGWCSPRAPRAG